MPDERAMQGASATPEKFFDPAVAVAALEAEQAREEKRKRERPSCRQSSTLVSPPARDS